MREPGAPRRIAPQLDELELLRADPPTLALNEAMLRIEREGGCVRRGRP